MVSQPLVHSVALLETALGPKVAGARAPGLAMTTYTLAARIRADKAKVVRNREMFRILIVRLLKSEPHVALCVSKWLAS